MAIFGCSLEETREFVNEITKIQNRLKNDKKLLTQLLNQEDEYLKIKEYFSNFLSFLTYSKDLTVESIYRVRKCDEIATPFNQRKELGYPPPSTDHHDRMNNTAFRVLYTSLHEYTAMSEARIDHDYIGKYFQLTRFSANKPIKVYEIGLFSELYFNSPRDSEFVKNKTKNILGEGEHDTTVRGYSALECAIAGILYNKGEKYHILSSILADAIFAINSEVEAIMYPSMQNRYGINLAIKKDLADKLSMKYTCLNLLEDSYGNGFYKYKTIKECLENIEDETLCFNEIGNTSSCFR
jgi:hypothetical protein